MKRRQVIKSGVVIGSVGIAGCTGNSTRVQDIEGDNWGCDIEELQTVAELDFPTYGPEEAEVTVRTFEDFSCPHCRDFHQREIPILINEINERDDRQFKLEHVDAPIPVDNWSEPMASAGRYIQDNFGDEAFYDFTGEIYQHQNNYSAERVAEVMLETTAADSPCEFLSSIDSLQYLPVIDESQELAFGEVGISGTPGVTINGVIMESVDARSLIDGVDSIYDQI